MKKAKSALLFLSGFGITGGVVALIVVAGSYGLSEFTGLDPLGTVLRALDHEALAQSTQGHDREILYWVAPMDPNYRRDKPGKSPMGMDLVPVFAADSDADESRAEATPETGKEKKILYWVAPMDPNYRRDEPGKSPMGMDLVPVFADDSDADGVSSTRSSAGGAVRISPAVINNMGVRTAGVERTDIFREVRTVGYVEFDETRIANVHLRTDGWIERLHVKAEGERVRKGQILFEVYSPTLANAQEEYIQALSFARKNLIEATRKRLRALGISVSRIRELEETRRTGGLVPIFARQSGIVAELNVREGAHVKPGTNIMTLADLSTVWVIADVFEQQAGWVRRGQHAEVRLNYMPNRVWEGAVDYVYPSMDRKARTLRVRLRFDNSDGALKPDMFARVVIHSEPRTRALTIPLEAVIRTGTSQRVIRSLGGGRFAPVEIETGTESGDRVEILSGLEEGDEIVVSAQFLIDSEASIRASFTRMTDAGVRPDESMEGKTQRTSREESLAGAR